MSGVRLSSSTKNMKNAGASPPSSSGWSWRRHPYCYRRHPYRVRQRKMKVTRFGSGEKRTSFWRIRIRPVRFIQSPLKLLRKLKNAFANVALLNTHNAFGAKRIPGDRSRNKVYSTIQFQDRLLFEIHKSLSATHELYGTS